MGVPRELGPQIVEHLMDERTSFVPEHERVDGRDQHFALRGRVPHQDTALRFALPFAAEHLSGLDVLALIVPFVPVRVAWLKQRNIRIVPCQHEDGDRIVRPLVEIEGREILPVEDGMLAADDVAGGVAGFESDSVTGQRLNLGRQRWRDIPYQQGASILAGRAELRDEFLILDVPGSIDQDQLVAPHVERLERYGEILETALRLRFGIRGDPYDAAFFGDGFVDEGLLAHGPLVGQRGVYVAERRFHTIEQGPGPVEGQPGVVSGIECCGVGA